MRGDGIRRRKDRGNSYWLSWTDSQGIRHRKKAERQSFNGARSELEKIRAQIEADNETTGAGTFQELSKSYLADRQPYVSAKEFERQESIVRVHLQPFFRSKLREITPDAVSRLVAERSGKVTPGCVRKEVGVLKRILKFAVRKGMLASNPADGVQLPRQSLERVRYLQPEEFQALLQHCPPNLRPVVRLAVHTGMRRGELLRLRWLDVDLLNRKAILPKTKNGRGRVVYLNSEAMDVFRDLALDIETRPEEPVFKLGVTPDEVSFQFAESCQKANISDFHFHDLRHTCASWMRQQGIGLDVIAKQLGHADLRMTSRYAHLDEDVQIRDAVDSLEKILRHPKGTGFEKSSGINKIRMQ